MATLSWPVGAMLALAITAGLVAFWWLAGLLAARLNRAISDAPWQNRPPLHIGKFQVSGSGWLRGALTLANRLGLALLRVLAIPIWLLLVVLVLPVWDDVPHTLWQFILVSATDARGSLIAFLPNLGRIILIIVVVRIALTVLRWIFNEIRRERIRLRNFHPSWARQTFTLIRFAVIAVAAILVFPMLPGSGSSGFQGIAIFIGALVSIGASTAVANAVAGIVLTYTKAFQQGERVKIHDTTGDVISRSMFVTLIRTIKNEEIAIPNQLVLAGPIINYSRDAGGNGVAVEIGIGLGYDVPWREVHRLIQEATNLDEVMKDPAPRIYQSELGDFAVAYTVHVFVEDPRTMASLRSTIIQRIMDLFGEAGIEILSPNHIAMRDGAAIIPGSGSKQSGAPDGADAPIQADVPLDEFAPLPDPVTGDSPEESPGGTPLDPNPSDGEPPGDPAAEQPPAKTPPSDQGEPTGGSA